MWASQHGRPSDEDSLRHRMPPLSAELPLMAPYNNRCIARLFQRLARSLAQHHRILSGNFFVCLFLSILSRPLMHIYNERYTHISKILIKAISKIYINLSCLFSPVKVHSSEYIQAASSLSLYVVVLYLRLWIRPSTPISVSTASASRPRAPTKREEVVMLQ
jgi:hypothetical protein